MPPRILVLIFIWSSPPSARSRARLSAHAKLASADLGLDLHLQFTSSPSLQGDDFVAQRDGGRGGPVLDGDAERLAQGVGQVRHRARRAFAQQMMNGKLIA